MEDWLRDLQYALRGVRRAPGFSAGVIVTLALAIAANTAIFSVMNAVLFRPLPYSRPDELITVGQRVSPPEFREWKHSSYSFSKLGAYQPTRADLTANGITERSLFACNVSDEILQALEVQPFLGRAFLPEDERPGNNHVVILSFRIWTTLLNSASDILGKPVRIGGVPHSVIGIMPRSFSFPPSSAWPTEMWMPLALSEEMVTQRDARILKVLGRLRPTVSLSEAQSEIQAIARRMASEEPGTVTSSDVSLAPVRREPARKTRDGLLALMGAAGFVLLLACANVAILLAARAASRRKEVCVRIAIGATRSHVVRQLLTEGLLLALLSGSFGFLIALGCIRAFRFWIPPDLFNLPADAGLDGAVFLFASLACLSVSIIFGFLPALHLSKTDFAAWLKESGPSLGSRTGFLRRMLLVLETATALILLIGAGLLIRTVTGLWSVPLGFNALHVLVLSIELPRTKYAEPEQWEAFWKRTLNGVRSVPGVEDAGGINGLPFWGYSMLGFRIAGPNHQESLRIRTQMMMTTPRYFSTMGTPAIVGRDFTESDTGQSPRVVIINQRMQRRFWPDQNAVGQRILYDAGDGEVPAQIVGVVGDMHQEGFAQAPEPTFYLPYAQFPGPGMTFVIRTAAEPHRFVPSVLGEIRGMDADVSVSDLTTMKEVLEDSVAVQRLAQLVLTLFAGLALLLAAVGVFAVVAYTVAQRTHEMGVRIALGAHHGEILRLVLGQAIRPILAGIALGTMGALMSTRVLSSLLFGVTPTDPITFTFSAGCLVLVGLIASYLPARRAISVNPVDVLRV